MSTERTARITWPIEGTTLIYVLIWVPYIAMTRMLATIGGKPLTGLQMLPVQVIATAVCIYVFLYVTGWWRAAHRLAGARLPFPTRWTALSGLATSLILVTVPLLLTFPDVSVPFALLLMRGDVLIVAPVVDLISGRKVRWYSWIALLVVMAGLVITVWGRGSMRLPLECIVAVAVYVVAYFVRLAIMTRCAKRDDSKLLKSYFVEEQIVAYPATILLLLAFSAIFPVQGADLWWGFTAVWHYSGLFLILVTGVLTAVIAVVAALILLDPRENTYCVPLERSASVLGGLIAAYVLAAIFDIPPPSGADLAGAILLICAIAILTLGPRLRVLTPRVSPAVERAVDSAVDIE